MGREQFPNNVIPANLISPVWRDVLNYYPLPNTTQDVNRNGLPDDFVASSARSRNDRDNFDLKLTYQRSPSHSIWTKFAMLDAEVVDNFSLGFDEGSLGDTRVYMAGIGHTWTLGPNLVLDGNLGHEPPGPAGDRARLRREPRPRRPGHPGHQRERTRQRPAPLRHPVRHRNAGGTNTQHYDIGTTPNWMPLFRKERSYTFSSALTWINGRHQVRTGIDVVRHELNHLQAEFGGFGGVRGGFQFNGLVTGDPRVHPAGLERAGGLRPRPARRSGRRTCRRSR